MNRKTFQALARVRLKEARVLLRNECFSGAYYLVGYAVECALKACIAKKTERYDFPPHWEKVREIYTHDLGKLVKIADMVKQREAESSTDAVFQKYWQLVLKWSEAKRYEIH